MSVARLLNPASIAIVGASERIGPGFNAWRSLQYVGYTGRVYLVNPRTPTVLGQPTYASLASIPEQVDAAFVAVPRAAVLDTVREAADKGAGGVAVLSSGFGEAGRLARRRSAIGRPSRARVIWRCAGRTVWACSTSRAARAVHRLPGGAEGDRGGDGAQDGGGNGEAAPRLRRRGP